MRERIKNKDIWDKIEMTSMVDKMRGRGKDDLDM